MYEAHYVTFVVRRLVVSTSYFSYTLFPFNICSVYR